MKEYILSTSNEPSFNLAAEEYLLKNTTDNFFIVYVNKPSVIIGRNQNPFEEINIEYVKENKIPIYRRATGGGTVYHDFGNINFSFIKNGLNELSNYKFFIKQITEPLKAVGIELDFKEKSHIFLKGKKVSGNAQTFYKNRMLHHGTLLHSSDLDKLNSSLGSSELIESKSIKSEPVLTTNLEKYIEFDSLINTILPSYRNFTEEEVRSIKAIESKYTSWKWTFGESPKYKVSNKIDNDNLEIYVRNGIMESVSINEKKIKYLIDLPFTKSSFSKLKDNPRIFDKIKTLL